MESKQEKQAGYLVHVFHLAKQVLAGYCSGLIYIYKIK